MEKIISKKIDNLFFLNNKLRELIEGKFKEDIKSENFLSLFMSFVMGKSFKTHESIILLCKNGYGEDAFILARSLFELGIMTLYILQDKTEKRFFRYMEYDWVDRKEMYDYCCSKDNFLNQLNKKTKPEEVNTIEEIKLEYKRVMKKYRYSRQLGWSDKSIAGMAKSIGRIDAYRTIYRLQCQISHNNAICMNEYIKEEKEDLIFNIGINSKMIEKTLIFVFDFFQMIVKEASRQFNWDLESAIKNLTDQYIEEFSRANDS